MVVDFPSFPFRVHATAALGLLACSCQESRQTCPTNPAAGLCLVTGSASFFCFPTHPPRRLVARSCTCHGAMAPFIPIRSDPSLARYVHSTPFRPAPHHFFILNSLDIVIFLIVTQVQKVIYFRSKWVGADWWRQRLYRYHIHPIMLVKRILSLSNVHFPRRYSCCSFFYTRNLIQPAVQSRFVLLIFLQKERRCIFKNKGRFAATAGASRAPFVSKPIVLKATAVYVKLLLGLPATLRALPKPGPK